MELEEEPVAAKKFGFDKSDDIVRQISTVNPVEDFKKMISEK